MQTAMAMARGASPGRLFSLLWRYPFRLSLNSDSWQHSGAVKLAGPCCKLSTVIDSSQSSSSRGGRGAFPVVQKDVERAITSNLCRIRRVLEKRKRSRRMQDCVLMDICSCFCA